MTSRWRSRVMKLAILAFIVAGYIANALSESSCRQEVGAWLFKAIGERSFYLVEPNQGSSATFDSLGATWWALPSRSSDDPTTWPRLKMKTIL